MRIGIIGGGQLARMLIFAAYEIGFDCAVYLPAAASPVNELVPCYIGDFSDNPQLDKFLQAVDVVTYESENVSVEFLQLVAKKKNVLPSIEAIALCQDRLNEKECFLALNIPTNRFVEVSQYADLQKAAEELGFPFVLKTRREGYDGKGQTVIKNHDQLSSFKDLNHYQFIAEEWVNYDREVSVVAVRDAQGNFAYYDLCENYHRDGILFSTHVRKQDPSLSKAKEYIGLLMNKLDYVGVMALELFECSGNLLANEVAPRVHNSGHWTLKGAYTSQFENHVRAISGLPLGSTESVASACVLYNIISRNIDAKSILNIPGAYYYSYKKQARPGRKLGHVILLETHHSPLVNQEKLVQEIIA